MLQLLVNAFHRPSTQAFRVLHGVVGFLIAISVVIFVADALSGWAIPAWMALLDRA